MRAVVCGAGIAGLTLAWWLERDGWEVLLVERAPGPREAALSGSPAGSTGKAAISVPLRDEPPTPHLVRVVRALAPAALARPGRRTPLLNLREPAAAARALWKLQS